MKKSKMIIWIMLVFSSTSYIADAENNNRCPYKTRDSGVSESIKRCISGEMAASVIKEISRDFSEKINKKTTTNMLTPPSAQPGSYSLTPSLNQSKDENLKDLLRDNFGA